MNSRESISGRVYSGFRRAVLVPAVLVFFGVSAATAPLLRFSLANLRRAQVLDREKRMLAAADRARGEVKLALRENRPGKNPHDRILVMKRHVPDWLLPGTRYPEDYTRQSIRLRFARNFAGISLKTDLKAYLENHGDAPDKQFAHIETYMRGKVSRVVYPMKRFGNTLSAPGERIALRMAVTGDGFLEYRPGRFTAYLPLEPEDGSGPYVVAVMASENRSSVLAGRMQAWAIPSALALGLFSALLVLVILSRLGKRTASAEGRLRREHEEEAVALERFAPRSFLSLLGAGGPADAAGDARVRREATILTIEARCLDEFTRELSSEVVFQLINDYAQWAGSVIEEQGGWLNRLTGDTWLALFPERPEGALLSAAELIRDLPGFNARRPEGHPSPPELVMGIHTGPVHLGLAGPGKRLDPVLISDAARITNRVRGLAAVMGADIACGEETLYAVENPDDFGHRFLGTVPTRGRERISVFEIFEGASGDAVALKTETRMEFENGIERFYAREFAAAAEIFTAVLERNPEDRAAELYLQRSREYA